MGPIPDNLPGYQELEPEVLDKFEETWGVRPPDEEGLRVTGTFEEAHEKNLRGIDIMDENPVCSRKRTSGTQKKPSRNSISSASRRCS